MSHNSQQHSFPIHAYVPITTLHKAPNVEILLLARRDTEANSEGYMDGEAEMLPDYIVEKRGVSQGEHDMTRVIYHMQMDATDGLEHRNENGKRVRRMDDSQNCTVRVLHMDEVMDEDTQHTAPIRRIFMRYYPMTLHSYLIHRRKQMRRMHGTSLSSEPSRSSSNQSLPLLETKHLIRSILQALSHLHSHSLSHRDIKPANILLHDSMYQDSYNGALETLIERHVRYDVSHHMHPYQAYTCILTDFEFAKRLEDNSLSHSQLGTMDFLSPEVVNHQHYDEKVDCWAVGVILMEMLLGANPMRYHVRRGMEPREAIASIAQQQDELDVGKMLGPLLKEGILNDDAVDFACGLLDRNMSSRFSAEEALQHVWLREDESQDTESQTNTPSTPSHKNPNRDTCWILCPSREFPRWYFMQPGREWVFKSVLRSQSDTLRHTFFLERPGQYQIYVGIKSAGSIWKYFRGVNLRISGAYSADIVLKENAKTHTLGEKRDSTVEKLRLEISIQPENWIGYMLWTDWVEFEIRLMWCASE